MPLPSGYTSVCIDCSIFVYVPYILYMGGHVRGGGTASFFLYILCTLNAHNDVVTAADYFSGNVLEIYPLVDLENLSYWDQTFVNQPWELTFGN